jgi:endonuclease/exonuclease/phosphatase family metal-dependent hydrolase
VIDNYAGGIIIGDLNCGPEASAANYEYLVTTHQFRDTYLEAQASGTLLRGPAFSWDPENYLNQIGPHSECPGQRCDHILLQRGYELDQWEVTEAQMVFTERFVEIGKREVLSTLSDHHGLVVTLQNKKRAPAGGEGEEFELTISDKL